MEQSRQQADIDRLVTLPWWMAAVALSEHVATCTYCANDRVDLCRVKGYSDRLREVIADGDEAMQRRMLGRAAKDNRAALDRLA